MYDIKDKKYYVNEKGSKDYPLTDLNTKSKKRFININDKNFQMQSAKNSMTVEELQDIYR